MHILSIIGTRPNFIKIAPFIKAIKKHNKANNNQYNESVRHLLVHTGQHYDKKLNDTFFSYLKIQNPNINLGIGSGTHAEQVGQIMIEFEKILKIERPDWVVVLGDVNSTLACSITAKKENIKCCHIEAGLRSGDMSMPEEINRIITDRISDLLLTPDLNSSQNLYKEGISENKIKFVGNIMIDSLLSNINRAKNLKLIDIVEANKCSTSVIHDNKIVVRSNSYILMTLHRPSNVDNEDILVRIIRFLISDLSKEMPIIWPIHPRTLKQLNKYNLFQEIDNCRNIILLDPINYIDMINLNTNARIVITDSGGIQEECTVIGTPCLILRQNTERPITLSKNQGTSMLVGTDPNRIKKSYYKVLTNKKIPVHPPLWDGHTAERCLKEILTYRPE